jgi:hypothetical protein
MQSSDGPSQQGMIPIGDVNFDGGGDCAVRDARNDCDHGASYRVFLFDSKKGRFAENAAFSAVSQEWCGLFEVDPVRKELRTHRQLGCAPEEPCWHGYARWQVVEGVPVPVNRRTVQRVPGEREGEWVMVEREERFEDGLWMLMPRRLVEE